MTSTTTDPAAPVDLPLEVPAEATRTPSDLGTLNSVMEEHAAGRMHTADFLTRIAEMHNKFLGG